VDCADYRIDCDGDSDSDGNRILHRVLNKKEKRAVRPAFYLCRYDNRRLEEEVAVVNHS
jgi:hypothetical protein